MMLGAGVLSSITPHRYWRITNTSASQSPNWQSFWQISFFSSTDGSGTDLCLSKTASARDSYGGFPASYANDNNSGTRWANNNDHPTGEWWAIDLVTPSEVHSIKLAGFFGNPMVYFSLNWDLEWSDDNTNWTKQTSVTLIGTASVQTFTNL